MWNKQDYNKIKTTKKWLYYDINDGIYDLTYII